MAYDLTHLSARLNLQKCLRSNPRSREFCKAHNTLKLPHPSCILRRWDGPIASNARSEVRTCLINSFRGVLVLCQRLWTVGVTMVGSGQSASAVDGRTQWRCIALRALTALGGGHSQWTNA